MKSVQGKNKLKRKVHTIPDFVEKELKQKKLLKAYEQRPDYQRNDYIGWIQRAKLEETKQKRLQIMLEDLKKGDEYMGMKYAPK